MSLLDKIIDSYRGLMTLLDSHCQLMAILIFIQLGIPHTHWVVSNPVPAAFNTISLGILDCHLKLELGRTVLPWFQT